MKKIFVTVTGFVGTSIASLFGGWDTSMITLLIFMAIDYLTGLMVAGVFHNSPKSDNGSLESKAGWKGLCRKAMILVFVVIATRLDLLVGSSYIRDGVCIAFITNEAISILENAGLMGLPIPHLLSEAIDILRKDDEE